MRCPLLIGTAFCCLVGPVVGSAAQAQELNGSLALLGQARDGDQSRATEAPLDMYGDLGVSGLRYRSRVDTFFRLERDFGRDDTSTDFYAGSITVPRAVPGVSFTVGRQFLGDVPGGVFVADAGRVTIDPGWPVAFTVFGGRPRYFEPTFSTDLLSQDETLWGGSIRTTRWRGGQVNAGYEQLERNGRVIRQLLTSSAVQGFDGFFGRPQLYGSVAYDSDRQNLDLATAGLNLSWEDPHLRFNFEGTRYKPQDHERDRPEADINRREDAIFELIAASRLVQFRGGIQYAATPELSAFCDYSFQNYDHQTRQQRENSHVADAGLVWMPGGDGLELLRLQYYLIRTEDGDVNGGKAYYENRVYENVVFRTKMDVTHYEKKLNKQDTAISGLLGIGYVILPGFTWEVNFEANHNDRFNEDFRFGFDIRYNFRQQVNGPSALRRQS